MSTYQKPDIDVVIFDNGKRRSEKSPTEMGSVVFNKDMTFKAGDELQISLWLRTSKAGNQYKSGLIAPKWEPKDSPTGDRRRRPEQSPLPAGTVDVDF